jgi:hypothetical protein
MASQSDIDSKSIVRKYLERQVVVDREDQTVDSADEIQALLEAVATSFLLYPQAALSFVLMAKNTLQQVVNSDLEIINYLITAVRDVSNPDVVVSNTSDLVEAQAALVDVDRAGRISSDLRAYERYTSAVNRFLDQQLAPSLKRRRIDEFERSGTEAKQDLFRVLSAFEPTHTLMAERLSLLAKAVSSFQSVDLSRIVSTMTVSKVRGSLQKLLQGLRAQKVSNTVAALELLAGAAALQSVSNSKDVYDKLVDTGKQPVGRTIQASSESVAAVATGTSTSTSLAALDTPWLFNVVVDGTETVSAELPTTGASGRAWVAGDRDDNSAPFVISGSAKTLYIQLDGLTPPTGEPALVYTVTLPTGTVSLATIITTINGVTGSDATATELGDDSNRLIIYGSSSVTRIVVRTTMPGSFDLITGEFTAAPGAANTALGFTEDQKSGDPEVFTAEELVSLLASNLKTADVELVDEAATITSQSTALTSSLDFSGAVAAAFGFSDAEAEPGYLVLVEDGEEVDPADLGILVGSIVTVLDNPTLQRRHMVASVSSIDGTHLLFDSVDNLPRCSEEKVSINSPAVAVVQTLTDSVKALVGSFDDDALDLQRVLTPLLSRATLAQVNDAKRVLGDVKSRLTSLLSTLSSTVLRDDQTDFISVARNIVASLEERGLDRGIDLLTQGDFTSFFSLTNEVAAKSSRFMKSMEETVSKDFATSSVEQELRDQTPRGTTPDDSILEGNDLPDSDEDVT